MAFHSEAGNVIQTVFNYNNDESSIDTFSQAVGSFTEIDASMRTTITPKFSDSLIPENVSDYRLVDRKVLDAVQKLGEVNRFYRGFFSWVGFKSIGIEFES